MTTPIQLKSDNLQKHITKITKENVQRPILQNVLYAADGSLTVTDTHRLLRIDDFHSFTDTLVMDPVTMQISDETFPETSTLIPDITKAKSIVTISLRSLKRAITAMKVSKNERVQLSVKKGSLTITNQSDIASKSPDFRAVIETEGSGKAVDVYYNSRYMLDAINFMLDAKPRTAKDDVTLYITSYTAPIVFKIDDQNLTYIVSPLRTSVSV